MTFRRIASKYSNRTNSLCSLGHSHRSRLESAVCGHYALLMKAGELVSVEVEKHMKICGPPGHECQSTKKIELVVDFKLIRPNGSVYYGEAKGYEDQKWPLKRRLWMHYKIGELEIWKGTHSRPILDEVII